MPRDAPRFYLITPLISDCAPYPRVFGAAIAVFADPRDAARLMAPTLGSAQ